MFDFTNKVVMVTGASSGLGKQMAEGYAEQGANLVLLARRIHLLDTIKKARFNERTLLQTSTHYYSLTLCATSCDGG